MISVVFITIRENGSFLSPNMLFNTSFNGYNDYLFSPGIGAVQSGLFAYEVLGGFKLSNFNMILPEL